MGLRKTLARMGVSAVGSYIGGALFDTLELAPEVVTRCFPAAAAWPGRLGFDDLGARILRRVAAAVELAAAGPSASWPIRGLPATVPTASTTATRRWSSASSRRSRTARVRLRGR